VFESDFIEGQSVRATQGSQRIIIPISTTSFEVYHNLLFSLYSDVIAPIDLDRVPGLSATLSAPEPCDLEELFCLTDQYQLTDLNQRIGDYLVSSAKNELLINRLFGSLSVKYPKLQERYLHKFKFHWEELNRNGTFAKTMDEIEPEDRAFAFDFIAATMMEMTFKSESGFTSRKRARRSVSTAENFNPFSP
jgi:hypothetical protein